MWQLPSRRDEGCPTLRIPGPPRTALSISFTCRTPLRTWIRSKGRASHLRQWRWGEAAGKEGEVSGAIAREPWPENHQCGDPQMRNRGRVVNSMGGGLHVIGGRLGGDRSEREESARPPPPPIHLRFSASTNVEASGGSCYVAMVLGWGGTVCGGARLT